MAWNPHSSTPTRLARWGGGGRARQSQVSKPTMTAPRPSSSPSSASPPLCTRPPPPCSPSLLPQVDEGADYLERLPGARFAGKAGWVFGMWMAGGSGRLQGHAVVDSLGSALGGCGCVRASRATTVCSSSPVVVVALPDRASPPPPSLPGGTLPRQDEYSTATRIPLGLPAGRLRGHGRDSCLRWGGDEQTERERTECGAECRGHHGRHCCLRVVRGPHTCYSQNAIPFPVIHPPLINRPMCTGMGIDKANVRTIIHFGAPASLVGRGGRRAGDGSSRERRLWGPAGAGLPSLSWL